jgi:hypothetical protein
VRRGGFWEGRGIRGGDRNKTTMGRGRDGRREVRGRLLKSAAEKQRQLRVHRLA